MAADPVNTYWGSEVYDSSKAFWIENSKESDGPGTSWSESSEDPSGSIFRAPKYFKLLLERQSLLGYQTKINHEQIFLCDYYADVADFSYTENYINLFLC